MDLQALEETYITAPEIARRTGRKLATVHSWLRYHRFMPYETAFGKPIVKREDFEQFQKEHPELIRENAQAV